MSGLAALRCIHLLACALVAGAAAFELLVLRRAMDASDPSGIAMPVRRGLRALGIAGIVAALLSWAGWLAQVAIGMTGLPADEALAPGNLRIVLERTTFGHAWLLRSGLLIVLLAMFLRRGAKGLPTLAVSALLLGSLAWAGHAVASVPAHVWVDAAHLCAAALWVGMLPPLWLVLRRAGRDPAWLQAAGRAAHFFSPAGIAAVLVLAGTGVLNSWWLVGSPEGLVDSRYGLLLSAKLALFALMLALAASNRMVLSPRLAAPGDAQAGAARQLRRNVVAEMLLAAAVLAVVGVLGVTPPAVHEQQPEHHHAGHVFDPSRASRWRG